MANKLQRQTGDLRMDNVAKSASKLLKKLERAERLRDKLLKLEKK